MSLTFPTDFHSNCFFLSTGIRCYQSFALFNSRKWKIKYSTHFDIHNMSAHMRRSIATTMVKKNPKRSDQYGMKKSWELFWPSPSVYTDGVDSMYKQYMNRILILIFIPMVSIVFILMTELSELMFDLWSIVNTIDISTVIRGKDAIKSNLNAHYLTIKHVHSPPSRQGQASLIFDGRAHHLITCWDCQASSP